MPSSVNASRAAANTRSRLRTASWRIGRWEVSIAFYSSTTKRGGHSVYFYPGRPFRLYTQESIKEDEMAEVTKRTPRETMETRFNRILAGEFPIDLYAEDVEVENPLSPEGERRHIHGRDALQKGFTGMMSGSTIKAIKDLTIQETTDPEVIVSEFKVDIEIKESKKTYQLIFVMVTRVRDGLIVSTRDYSNSAWAQAQAS